MQGTARVFTEKKIHLSLQQHAREKINDFLPGDVKSLLIN